MNDLIPVVLLFVGLGALFLFIIGPIIVIVLLVKVRATQEDLLRQISLLRQAVMFERTAVGKETRAPAGTPVVNTPKPSPQKAPTPPPPPQEPAAPPKPPARAAIYVRFKESFETAPLAKPTRKRKARVCPQIAQMGRDGGSMKDVRQRFLIPHFLTTKIA